LSPQARAVLTARVQVGASDQQPHPATAAGSGPPPLERRGAASAPLSFAQERLWFIEQLEDDAVHHNDGMLLLLRGALDVEAMRQAIESIIGRHEILRTAFRRDGERVVQVVTEPRPLSLPIVALPGAQASPDDPVLMGAFRDEMAAPLDLATGQTLRTSLYRIDADRHVLAVTVHHLVCDLWSFAIFGRELGVHYTAYREGRADVPMPELPVQYGDYAAWQRSWLTEERLGDYLHGRIRALAGAPPVVTLPSRRARPAVQRFVGAVQRFHLDAASTQRLRTWSHANGATLFMSLLAGFKVLLARHTGQRDIVVASPTATRNPEQLEQLIGCFLNMIVMRTDLTGEPTFAEVVGRVRTACLDAYSHRDVPFEQLVTHLQPVRTRSHQPVAQVAFALQNTPMGELRLPDLRVDFHKADTGRARMDISVWITEAADGLAGELEYDTELYTAAQMEELTTQFVRLLRAATDDPQRPVWDLPILDDAQLHRIVHEWNDTRVDFGGDHLIHRLVEEQARRTPGAVAVVAGADRLTYGELNERANRLARHLRSLGVALESPVAVCLPRSVLEVVAILAVVKAGGCYVPISPRDPADRRDALLAQARPVLVLSAGDLCDEVWTPGRRVLDLEQDRAVIDREDGADLNTRLFPDNLAYTLFTSGSTGRPKGVLVSHRGFVNRMLWGQRNFPLSAADRVLRKAACTFDVSLDELFRALFNGATSVLMPDLDAFDPRRLAAVIAEHGVTDADFAPTALRELLTTVDADRLRSLRRIVSGVEELTPETQQLIYERLDVTLFNLYGPTEVSVSCTSWPGDRNDRRGFVPIGRPMSNVRVHVLDAGMRPVPPGVTGELYVGGAGLARGYLGSPGLTAQRFVPDPLGHEPGARLYRTGDLARYHDDGVLEFIGRVDGQLNLRGYRIEPGEVEASLREHPDVTDAAVLLRRDDTGDNRLVAYLVCDHLPAPAELRSFLRARVPDYMVPSRYVRLDSVPLTSHGKLDVAALPPPGPDGQPAGLADGTPRNDIERILLDIWSQVLARDGIGIHDDFFDLGGDSLTATRILARAGTELGVDVEVAAIFDAPTVAELAVRFAR
jgi:amino acid adenylation domain-containing protein